MSLTVPADFAAQDLFEIDGGAIREWTGAVRSEGRTLTLLDLSLGPEAVTRVFVIGAGAHVRAQVAAELAAL